MTSVWPALWPPWKRTTMSACSDNQSTILPFPSSPHWAPTTTTLAIRGHVPLQLPSYEHDWSGKWSPTSGSCAQRKSRPGPLACEACIRIKEAGGRGKQERGFWARESGDKPLISPENPHSCRNGPLPAVANARAPFARMVAMRRPRVDAERESVSVVRPGFSRPGTLPGRGPRRIEANRTPLMSASDQTTSPTASSGHWIANQPYLLLCITAACWGGNAIVGRLAAGHIPPVTLSFLRWSAASLLILPFAWKHLKRDWPAIRGKLGIMLLVSVTGIGVFNTLQYWSLEYTTALNTLLLQSAGPLIVAVWSLALLGVRLTLAQAIGVLLSLTGVMVILMHGDLTALSSISFNKGDLIFLVAMIIFSLYSVLTLKRPAIHGLSFAAFTFGASTLFLIPLLIFELLSRPVMALDAQNLLSLAYVAVFPSIIAYLCFNRGVQL